MIWIKQDCTDEEFQQWHSNNAEIVSGLPPVWACLKVLNPFPDDGFRLHWLNTQIFPDDDMDLVLENVVEKNAYLSFTSDDPVVLVREARRILGQWLNSPPKWLQDWYREAWDEAAAETEEQPYEP